MCQHGKGVITILQGSAATQTANDTHYPAEHFQ